MEDGSVFPQDTIFGNISDATADFDFMDELLLGGCWLETANGSDFLQQDPFSSTAFFNPSYFLPSSENNSSFLNPNQSESNTQEEAERSVPPSNQLQTEISLNPQSTNQSSDRIAECSNQFQCYPAEGCSELNRRLWIRPRANPCPGYSVRERLVQALRYIKDSTENGDVLMQIWVPIKRGDDKQFLTTIDQPFSLDHSFGTLANYRSISESYNFSAEEYSNEYVGLPGRVFLGKAPEWTPDVQFFSSEEYPRVRFAQRCNVHGTIALPIFERDSRSCLGVLEVVMTTQKIKYRPELENICKALEAVDLRSSEVSSTTYVKACNESYQAAVPEIVEVLRAVCDTHKLPLAQTWVPCIQQGKGGCRRSDQNYAYCISTVTSACCVTDRYIQGFHDACSEHHLLRGQGVAGKALMTNQPCFRSDITAFNKEEYPLVHYARMFGLGASVAIRLRSIYTGKIDYVLEFFLPVDCRDTEEQSRMLHSLSIIIQRVCRNLRVVTDKEMEEETVSQVGEETCELASGPAQLSPQSTWIEHIMEAQQKHKSVQKEEVEEGFKVTREWDNPEAVSHQKQTFSDFNQHHQDSKPKNNVEYGEDSSFGEGSLSNAAKPTEKRRTKTEKSISLQVLRQYFAGSLKDAAKSIGVCPTTLKRICRQHGISRWPSRKIKKVGHSLRKLQVVIDSVQGAEGAFQIGSFYTNFPELTSPNLSRSNLFSKSKVNDHLKHTNIGSEDVPSPRAVDDLSSPLATASKSPSSSCSQSSSSSLSIGKQQSTPISHLAGINAAMVDTLKRTRSDAELCASVHEEPQCLARSQSHKSFREHPYRKNLPALPKSSRHGSRGKAALRVKVTCGEEKVRFSMQSYWRFEDLQQEIAKRFHIDDMGRVDLKYLDDDSEWVLLTCDADVEECIDVYKSSHSHTIKLSVHQVPHQNLGSSFGSRGPHD